MQTGRRESAGTWEQFSITSRSRRDLSGAVSWILVKQTEKNWNITVQDQRSHDLEYVLLVSRCYFNAVRVGSKLDHSNSVISVYKLDPPPDICFVDQQDSWAVFLLTRENTPGLHIFSSAEGTRL